ncbi:aldo/keto reductase [Flavobacterium caeni]|uniref:Predicted oxidoreductase n=1 Tax=Flavobacterium caeni TaxID=490189 RepID=A0A1G5GXP6_9FLAO|nr:aldo/keto reductase [Flavobacterium caeni]SCY56264.1 Predicted oxidoreductase [Flavobacterium caeni]
MSLSKIVAGTMNWGLWDKKLSTPEMAQLIHVCVENQITTFDHADIYGGYTTEAEFGRAFAQSHIGREKIQLISKCGIKNPGGARDIALKHYDYSKDYIVWSVEQSLKNLQTDYLDVLLLHRPSPLMIPEEIAVAVTKLKTEGKIKSFGLSNFTPSQTDLIRKFTQVDYNQIQFSATHFAPMVDGSLDHMQTHNIRPMAWNPLGTIFREDTEQTRRLKKLLADLVQKYGVGSDLILLAWILQHPAGVIPVAGTVNVARIQYLKKLDDIKLDLEDWFAIWTESMGKKVP